MRFLILAMAALSVSLQAPSQPEWKGKNLKYFPSDITRNALTQRMREFAFALDVRCPYCHAGGNGVTLDGVDFASDEKPTKLKARAMLRMTDEINAKLLADVPSRADPPVKVDCVTCHHGLPLPKTLQTTLREIVNKDGAAAAVARYRELRRDDTLSGRYNFGEWEITELARQIADKNPSAARALLEMNGEFYPKSGVIDFLLGELLRAGGEREKALQRYRMSLEKDPTNALTKQRIAELEKQ